MRVHNNLKKRCEDDVQSRVNVSLEQLRHLRPRVSSLCEHNEILSFEAQLCFQTDLPRIGLETSRLKQGLISFPNTMIVPVMINIDVHRILHSMNVRKKEDKNCDKHRVNSFPYLLNSN